MFEYSTPQKRQSDKLMLSSTPETVLSSTSWVSTSPPNVSHRSISINRLLKSNSIGSMWTVEIVTLKQSGTYFEAVQCLRRIRILLEDVDRADRLKFCKADFENAIKLLRKQKQVWSNELFKEVAVINFDFFNTNPFRKLPTVMFLEILQMLTIDEFLVVLCVNSEWCQIGRSDELWTEFYRRKFLLNNLASTLPDRRQCTMIASFHRRLNDPEIGDKIEVAWRGKFRLETQDVYTGLAWWVAEIVDKHPTQGRYKIRYPGWESRWDEWVPRSRLRWTVSRNILVSIRTGDIVELWCCGANVPGAWLECKVKKVRGSRYNLGKVVSSGNLWVERDRVRLVRRNNEMYSNNSNSNNNSGDTDSTTTIGNHNRLLLLRRQRTAVYRMITSLSDRIQDVCTSIRLGMGIDEALDTPPAIGTATHNDDAIVEANGDDGGGGGCVIM